MLAFEDSLGFGPIPGFAGYSEAVAVFVFHEAFVSSCVLHVSSPLGSVLDNVSVYTSM